MEMNMPVAPTGYGNFGGFGGLGGDNSWIIFLIALGFMGGFGGYGGFGNRGQLTQDNFIAAEFNHNNVLNGIRGLERGISDLGYSLNNTMVGQGESIRSSITNSAFANERSLAALSREVADCCCNTNRNIDSVRYDMAKGFCDVINAGHNNTRELMINNNQNTQRLVDLITGNEMQKVRDENYALKLQASQGAQSRVIEEAIQKYANIVIGHIPGMPMMK